MPWGSAQRRCAAAGYAALVLACVLAIYVLIRASEPVPWAGGPGCTSAWGALPVASNCDAVCCPASALFAASPQFLYT